MADEAAPLGTPAAIPSTVTEDSGTTRVQFGGDTQAEALANAASTGTQKEAPAARPEGLPEGFDTWEAYGKAQVAKAADAAAKEEPAAETSEVQAAVNQLPEAQREKALPFFQEFADTGSLTDESKAAAAAAFGVTPAMVDLYIAGAQTKAAQDLATAYAPLHEAAGGEETFKAFEAWATAGGLTAEQIASLDTAMNGKEGPAAVAKAVADWKAGGNAPAPRDITLKGGEGDAQPAIVGFRSLAEQTAAMSDPRYAKDEAYRKDVELKVAYATY